MLHKAKLYWKLWRKNLFVNEINSISEYLKNLFNTRPDSGDGSITSKVLLHEKMKTEHLWGD